MALEDGAVLVQLSRALFLKFIVEHPSALQIYLQQAIARLWRVAHFVLHDYLNLPLTSILPRSANEDFSATSMFTQSAQAAHWWSEGQAPAHDSINMNDPAQPQLNDIMWTSQNAHNRVRVPASDACYFMKTNSAGPLSFEADCSVLPPAAASSTSASKPVSVAPLLPVSPRNDAVECSPPAQLVPPVESAQRIAPNTEAIEHGTECESTPSSVFETFDPPESSLPMESTLSLVESLMSPRATSEAPNLCVDTTSSTRDTSPSHAHHEGTSLPRGLEHAGSNRLELMHSSLDAALSAPLATHADESASVQSRLPYVSELTMEQQRSNRLDSRSFSGEMNGGMGSPRGASQNHPFDFRKGERSSNGGDRMVYTRQSSNKSGMLHAIKPTANERDAALSTSGACSAWLNALHDLNFQYPLK